MPERDDQPSSSHPASANPARNVDDPDESHDEGMTDEKAAKALNKIEALRRRLEPRG